MRRETTLICILIAGCGSAEGGRPSAWTDLLTASWTVIPGTESYRCARATIRQDEFFNAVRVIAPLGTHHSLLTLEYDPSSPDGMSDCGPMVTGEMGIGAFGIGTPDLAFPPGLAVRLPARWQLVFNMHLFNATSTPLNGTSKV